MPCELSEVLHIHFCAQKFKCFSLMYNWASVCISGFALWHMCTSHISIFLLLCYSSGTLSTFIPYQVHVRSQMPLLLWFLLYILSSSPPSRVWKDFPFLWISISFYLNCSFEFVPYTFLIYGYVSFHKLSYSVENSKVKVLSSP